MKFLFMGIISFFLSFSLFLDCYANNFFEGQSKIVGSKTSALEDYYYLFEIKLTQGEFPEIEAGQAIEILNAPPYTFFAVAKQVSNKEIKVLVDAKNKLKMPENPSFKLASNYFDLSNLKAKIHIFSQGSGAGAAQFLVTKLIFQGIDPHRISLWQSSAFFSVLPNFDNFYEELKILGVSVFPILSREKHIDPYSPFYPYKGRINDLIGNPDLVSDELLCDFQDKNHDECSLFIIGSKEYTEDLKKALERRGIREPLRDNYSSK